MSQRILIFAPYLPNQGWGGGVILRSLTQNPPADCKLYWTTFNLRENQLQQTVNGIEILPFRTRYLRGRGVSELILHLESRRFAKDFNAFLRQNHIDRVWVVLAAAYDQLCLTNALVQKIQLPFHVSVHDDPILETAATQKQKAIRFFKNILTKANSIDVISTRMQRQYLDDYGVASTVVTRCIPNDFPQNTAINPSVKAILMGGYGNAAAPWPQPLFDAINLLNAQQNVSLLLFDSKLKPYENEYIKVFDLLPENEFNAMLTKVDIGYACDDLQAENLQFAQLSLPTKIITYIGAGIPFLYHGPKDSTVGDLIKQYEAGLIVDNNDAQALADGFRKLLSDYAYFRQNCRLATQSLFAQDTVQVQFYKLLLDKN